MRLLIVTPRQPRATGNTVTAMRLAGGLRELGHQVRLSEAAVGLPLSLGEEEAPFNPQLALLLHAFRAGAPWLCSQAAGRLPFAVLLAGTDIHGGIHDPVQAPVIWRVLRSAPRILTQNRLTAGELSRNCPELAERLRYLPPGVVLGDAPCPVVLHRLAEAGTPALLHAAGIRPVKGNLELLLLSDGLAAAKVPFTLSFCGPVLDQRYGERFFAALRERPWARYLGTVDPSAMPALLRQADLVLNHSESEGLPNVLVEAVALGRPILARAISGNAAVVDEAINGRLYRDDGEFLSIARELLLDPGQLRQLSNRGPDPGRFSPRREAERLKEIFREMLAEPNAEV